MPMAGVTVLLRSAAAAAAACEACELMGTAPEPPPPLANVLPRVALVGIIPAPFDDEEGEGPPPILKAGVEEFEDVEEVRELLPPALRSGAMASRLGSPAE